VSGGEPSGEAEIARLEAARIAEGELVQLEHPPYHVLVTRVGGVPYAIEDACPHSGRSLCAGSLRGHVVVCPGHGWEIDVRTGEVLTAAGRGDRAPRYAIREEGDQLMVSGPPSE